MEGILETKDYRFYTDDMSIINIACIKLWNKGLRESFNKKEANKLSKRDIENIFKFVKEHPELFFNTVTYYNMLDKLASMLVLMNPKEKCLVTYHP